MNKYLKSIIYKLYDNIVIYDWKTGISYVSVNGLEIDFDRIYNPGRGGRKPNPCKIYINDQWYSAESERALTRLLEENHIYISRATINKYNKGGIICYPRPLEK